MHSALPHDPVAYPESRCVTYRLRPELKTINGMATEMPEPPDDGGGQGTTVSVAKTSRLALPLMLSFAWLISARAGRVE